MCLQIISYCAECGRPFTPSPAIIETCRAVRRQHKGGGGGLLAACCFSAPRTRCKGLKKETRPPKDDWKCTKCHARGCPAAQQLMAHGGGAGMAEARIGHAGRQAGPARTQYSLTNRRVPRRDAPGFREHKRVESPGRARRAECAVRHGREHPETSDPATRVGVDHVARGGRSADRGGHGSHQMDRPHLQADHSQTRQQQQQPSSQPRAHDGDMSSRTHTRANRGEGTTTGLAMGEHSTEYWDALAKAYKSRGAPPSAPGQEDRAGPPRDETMHPRPLNLAAARYVAERRNAHLDHAMALAAGQSSAPRPQRRAGVSSTAAASRLPLSQQQRDDNKDSRPRRPNRAPAPAAQSNGKGGGAAEAASAKAPAKTPRVCRLGEHLPDDDNGLLQQRGSIPASRPRQEQQQQQQQEQEQQPALPLSTFNRRRRNAVAGILQAASPLCSPKAFVSAALRSRSTTTCGSAASSASFVCVDAARIERANKGHRTK